MTNETDDELIVRYVSVRDEHTKATKSMERTKSEGARMRKARWAGSLLFSLLGMESEAESRGLKLPRT
jgi:hypothetical protein